MDSSRRDTDSVPNEEMQVNISESQRDPNEVEMHVIDNSTDPNHMLGIEPAPYTTTLPASFVATAPFTSHRHTHSSSPSSSRPLTPQRSGIRRSRVEDDHDDERDRRHPSHRVGYSPQSSSSPSRSDSPVSPSPQITTPTDRGRENAGIPGIFRLVTGRSPGPSSPTSPIARPFRFFQHLIPPNRPNHPNPVSPPSAEPEVSSSVPGNPEQSTFTPSIAASTGTATANHANTNSDAAPRRDPPPNANTRNPHHQYLGGFAITIDMLGGMTTTPLHPVIPATGAEPNMETFSAAPPEPLQAPRDAGNGNDPPEGRAQTRTTPGSGSDAGDGNGTPAAAFAELLARVGLLAALGLPGMGLEREVEDPERAKKLIEGLEEVPIGLVKRLERVGGTGGGMGQDMSGGGDSGCAICWEKLLVDVDETEVEKEKKEQDKEQDKEQEVEGGDASKASEPKEHPKIVSLPCAHVFHADCLIPWFSRPRQTTCPTCRFNIDPENLTYTSRAQRRRAAEAQGAADGEAPTTVNGVQMQAQGNPDGGTGVGSTPGSPDTDDDGPGFPLFFGGFPSFIVPLRGVRDDPQAPPHPQTTVPSMQGVAPQPAPQPNSTQAGTGPAAANPNDNAGENRLRREFVTIGFDMYIGRGPPPPLPTRDTPASPATNPDATTNTTANAGGSPVQNQPPRQGGGVGGTTAFGFTLPLPLGGMGMGRTIGDVLQRVFGSVGGGRGAGNGNAGDAVRNTENAGNAMGNGSAGDGRGEPVMFGPERPPVLFPGSLPANVGLGAGNAQRPQGGPPIMLPFGFGSFPLPVPDHPVGTQSPLPQQPLPQQPLPQQPLPQQQQGTGQQIFVGSIPIFDYLGAGLRSPTDNTHPHPHGPAAQGGHPAPKRKWVPPPAPGLTLRQRIEKKEQEAGLRCCDVSCGVGPSDEDPWFDVIEQRMKQLRIWSLDRPGTSDGNSAFDSSLASAEQRRPVCPHTFHSSCLVSAERVVLALRDAEVVFVGPDGREEVEVSCPVCRGVGKVSKEEWNAGVRALS